VFRRSPPQTFSKAFKPFSVSAILSPVTFTCPRLTRSSMAASSSASLSVPGRSPLRAASDVAEAWLINLSRRIPLFWNWVYRNYSARVRFVGGMSKNVGQASNPVHYGPRSRPPLYAFPRNI
jgi:hypothetical protein